jgi:hypothetical protein
MLLSVGHVNGKADAYLTSHPSQQHHFTWINPKDDADYYAKSARGFEYVRKDGWTKNPKLWRWGASGYCEFLGLYMAARPAELYWQEEAERAPREDPQVVAQNRLLAQPAAQRGLVIAKDEGGRTLTQRATR